VSLGTKSYTFRLDDDLVARLEARIKRANRMRFDEPYTWSSAVRAALEEWVSKTDRNKKSRASRADRLANLRFSAVEGVTT
jgi:predicted transcriptional regulator